MLALRRTCDQEILIGDDIRIRVLSFDALQGAKPVVTLGIEAPRGIAIRRGEIDAEAQIARSQQLIERATARLEVGVSSELTRLAYEALISVEQQRIARLCD